MQGLTRLTEPTLHLSGPQIFATNVIAYQGIYLSNA